MNLDVCTVRFVEYYSIHTTNAQCPDI